MQICLYCSGKINCALFQFQSFTYWELMQIHLGAIYPYQDTKHCSFIWTYFSIIICWHGVWSHDHLNVSEKFKTSEGTGNYPISVLIINRCHCFISVFTFLYKMLFSIHFCKTIKYFPLTLDHQKFNNLFLILSECNVKFVHVNVIRETLKLSQLSLFCKLDFKQKYTCIFLLIISWLLTHKV